ncbi:MAG: hypothetical protein ABMA64_04720 [Myxococcota bacterium]
MSELARRRDARDLWISRGHLRAGAALGLLACAASFLLGFVVGRDHPPTPSTAAPDESLVDLLARIEATADPDAAVRELTFPDTLRAAVEPPPPPAESAATRFVIQLELADAPAAAAAEVALREAGLEPTRAGGDALRLTVGPWPTLEGAEASLATVRAAGYSAAVVPLP